MRIEADINKEDRPNKSSMARRYIEEGLLEIEKEKIDLSGKLGHT
jgi:hypothetical protein